MRYAAILLVVFVGAGPAPVRQPAKPLAKVVEEQAARIAQLEKRLNDLASRLEEAELRLAAVSPVTDRVRDAINRGDVLVGMTVADVNASLKCKGKMTGEANGVQTWEWKPTDYHNARMPFTGEKVLEAHTLGTYVASVRGGKVASYDHMPD